MAGSSWSGQAQRQARDSDPCSPTSGFDFLHQLQGFSAIWEALARAYDLNTRLSPGTDDPVLWHAEIRQSGSPTPNHVMLLTSHRLDREAHEHACAGGPGTGTVWRAPAARIAPFASHINIPSFHSRLTHRTRSQKTGLTRDSRMPPPPMRRGKMESSQDRLPSGLLIGGTGRMWSLIGGAVGPLEQQHLLWSDMPML